MGAQDTTIPPQDPQPPFPNEPQGPTGPNDLIFPGDLGSVIDHWIKFSSFSYSRSNRGSQPEQGAFKETVFLPMPSQINTKYNARYENEALGFLGNLGGNIGEAAASVGAVREFIAGNKLGGGTLNSLLDSVKDGAKNLPGQLTGAGIANSLDKFGAFGAGIAGGLGVARNPHLAVLYQGTTFRDHSFSFRMIPRNEIESEKLFQIITTFKTAMAPDFVEGSENFLFEYPDEWAITFHHKRHMFDIGPSVLKNFSVTYGSQEAGPKLFKDKRPVEINFTLDFQETSIVTKSDVQVGNR